MIRTLLGSAVCLALLCSVGCSREDPDPIPIPDGIDWEAAGELETDGNGLWILDGPSAMQQVLESMHHEDAVATSLHVQEMIPVDGGEVTLGREVTVERFGDRTASAANFAIGSQRGELISVAEEAWIRGNAAFMEEHGFTETDTFQCLAANSPVLADLDAFLDPESVLRTTATGLQIGVMAPEDESGPAILTLGADTAPVGQLTVRAHGTPLPQQLSIADESGTVRLDFDWNPGDTVEPPSSDDITCE